MDLAVQIDVLPFRNLELEACGGDTVDYPIADTPGFVRRGFLYQLPVKRNEIQGRLRRRLRTVGKEDRINQLRSACSWVQSHPLMLPGSRLMIVIFLGSFSIGPEPESGGYSSVLESPGSLQ